MRFVGKIIMLTFNDTEEKAVEKAIAAFADMIPLEAIQPPQSPALVFPGLEIRLHQRRVLKNGADIYLTRLEYGALCYLTASPGRVFTKAQIFESVWSVEYGKRKLPVKRGKRDLQSAEKNRAGQSQTHLHKNRFRYRL